MRLKSFILFPIFFIMGILLVQCTTSNKPETAKTSKITPISNLTQGEAELRAKQILKPTYFVTFDFDVTSTNYSSTTKINFQMKEPAATFLDFKTGEIISYTVNGQTKPVVYANNRIQLAKDDLKAGDNEVVIVFRQSFSNNGRGIYRFQDSVDSKVYIWTKLEPFDANHVFPCFDQPDLKTTIASEVTAPSAWKVVFATMESKKETLGEKTKWHFPASPIMSTYLFSLHAGDYEVWTDKYKNIPLRVFARASLKKFMDPAYWFKITKQGFAFFEKDFDYAYPFKKYDQLIVPEFSSGGMENVAAVNYNERVIYRGPASREEKESLANLMLHEMAHMWFGDLVTMKWWDELWLNESFATFMAFRALEKNTEYKQAWMSFQRRSKLTAYIEDQYVTTHPISTEVPDILSTFNHFDAITYSKGASAMYQLSYYIGEENFKKGIQQYFKDHAFTNTTLPQFIGALEKASGMDLRNWSVAWLRNSGLDTLKVTPECKDSNLTSIKFELKAQIDGSRPRPHKLPITLYKTQGNVVKTIALEDWKTNGDNETRQITKPTPCPDFILPNSTDVSFIKTHMTSEQIRWAQGNLHKISDPKARGVFWNQAYLNLRDGRINLEDFVKLLLAQIKNEKHPTVTQQFFTYWSAISFFLPQKTDIQLAVRSKILENLEDTFWNQVTDTPDPLWKKTLFSNWIPRVESAKGLANLHGILTSQVTLKPMLVDQDLRWSILKRLAALGHPQVEELAAAEKVRDPSESGFKSYLATQVSRPSLADKTKWLEEMNRPDMNWSLARKQSILYSMFPSTPKQNQLRDEFSGQFYKTMSVLDKRNEDISYNRTYAELAPWNCEESKIQELDSFIGNQDWNVTTKKVLLITNQENKICARVRSR